MTSPSSRPRLVTVETQPRTSHQASTATPDLPRSPASEDDSASRQSVTMPAAQKTPSSLDSQASSVSRDEFGEKFGLTVIALSLLIGIFASQPAQAKLLLKCDFETINGTQVDCVDHVMDPNAPVVGTIFGNPATAPGRGSGQATALSFDGVDDYVRFSGAADLIGEKAFTVEAWVKVSAFSTNVFRVQKPVVLHSDSFRVHKSTSWHDRLIAANTPPFNEWYHLAGVFDRGELRVYINGRLANVDTFGSESEDALGSTASFTDWGIGARPVGASADQFFTGQVDEISVHDEALSAVQILALAKNGSQATVLDVTAPPYNAAGDGTTDDATAIQSALTDAGPGGLASGAEVLLPSGIYRLGATLSIPSGVLVRGENGTILKRLSGTSPAVSPIVLFSGVADSTLRDIEIQGFTSGSSSTGGQLGILLEGTQRVHIDRVVIQDLGKEPMGSGNPSGAHIRVTGLSGIANPHSVGNVIENNVLDDSTRITNFGIRFKTEWANIDPTQPPELEIEENVVKNNLLEGFLQAIEIAGPGTTHNWIRGNVSKGAEESGIEADKGAKDNVYLDNYIRLPRSDTNAFVAGMRDQGTFFCIGNTLAYELFNERNIFRRNVIADVWNQKNAGGILVSRSDFLTFEDNYVRDVRAGNPQDAGMVLLSPTGVTNQAIQNNLSSGVDNLTATLPPAQTCN